MADPHEGIAQVTPTPSTPEIPPVVTPMWLDKAFIAKLLAPVISIAVVWVNHKTNLGLDPTAVDVFVAGVFMSAMTYIAAHKYKTAQIATALIKGQNQ